MHLSLSCKCFRKHWFEGFIEQMRFQTRGVGKILHDLDASAREVVKDFWDPNSDGR